MYTAASPPPLFQILTLYVLQTGLVPNNKIIDASSRKKEKKKKQKKKKKNFFFFFFVFKTETELVFALFGAKLV